MSDLELLAATMEEWSTTSGDHHMLAAAAIRQLIKLQAALQRSGEPVARVIDDGTPEGATEWILCYNRTRPLKAGDLLYPTPQPVVDVNQKLVEALQAVLDCGSTSDQWWIDKAREALLSAGKGGGE